MITSTTGFGRSSATDSMLAQIELILLLTTLRPASLTANGRLRAPDLRLLMRRMRAWASREATTGLPESPPDAFIVPIPIVISVAERLNIVGATSDRLRPLPSAASWLASSRIEQSRALSAALTDMGPAGESTALSLVLHDQESHDADDCAPAIRLLQLKEDLSLLDGPRTLLGARLALAVWAEWDDARSCLRLTEASVSRAATPILAAGQDAASVLADLLLRVAEPAPTEAQLRRMHGWCVARPAGHAGDQRQLPRQRNRRSQPDDAGTMAWRLAALRLVATLAPSVPGIGTPPAEAYEGLAAAADPALDALVAGWVAAIMNAKGVGGLPVGVDPALLETVEAALAMGEGLHLRYRSDEAVETWREVMPLRLEWQRGRLLLVAHCLLRDAERHFRMDRVLDARPAVGRLAADGETT